MERDEIAARLKSYIEDEFPNPGGIELTTSTNLLEDWFIDSISIVTTVLHLEKQYGINVQRGDINAENFESIDTLASYVARNLQKDSA